MAESRTDKGPPSGGDIAVLEVVTVIARRRWFILRFVGACTILVAVISMVMPHTYEAHVSILPPEKSDRSGLSALLAASPTSMLDMSSFGENRSSDFYLDLLRSRTVVDSLFASYPDVHAYFAARGTDRSVQLDAFDADVSSDAGRDGLVTVTARLSTSMFSSGDEDRRIAALAARTAGGMAVELDRLNRMKIYSRAHNARVYVEEQGQRVKHQIDSLYARFTEFQNTNRVLALDKQVEGEVKSASDLQAQIMELEYQQRYLLRTQTSTNLESQQLRDRLAALKEQYAKLQAGGDTSDYFLPFPEIPALQKTYANMVRDLKALEGVYAYLQTQYFQERVQEERDTPTVQVLDAPMVPERRSSPRRMLMVLFGLGAGIVLACGWVLLREFVFSMSRHPDERERVRALLAAIAPRARVPAGDEPDAAPRKSANGRPPVNGEHA